MPKTRQVTTWLVNWPQLSLRTETLLTNLSSLIRRFQLCVTPSLAEKRIRVFVRRLFLAEAACSPCLPSPTHVYVPIWCCKQITSKRHVHRPTILNSLSAGDGRLHRIVLIFRCPRTITDISVIRLSLMWCVPAKTTRHGPVSKLRLLTAFSTHAVFPVPAPPLGLPSLREVA